MDFLKIPSDYDILDNGPPIAKNKWDGFDVTLHMPLNEGAQFMIYVAPPKSAGGGKSMSWEKSREYMGKFKSCLQMLPEDYDVECAEYDWQRNTLQISIIANNSLYERIAKERPVLGDYRKAAMIHAFQKISASIIAAPSKPGAIKNDDEDSLPRDAFEDSFSVQRSVHRPGRKIIPASPPYIPPLPPENKSERGSLAGKLLRFFRARRGIAAEKLSTKLNLPGHSVPSWEQGSPIAGPKLEEIDRLLGLSPDESRQLFDLRFPEFNEEWLSRQPAASRRGLLVKACRKLAGLTRKDLAAEMNIGESCYEVLESPAAVPSDLIPRIVEIFAGKLPGQFDKKYFLRMYEESSMAIQGAASPAQNGHVPSPASGAMPEKIPEPAADPQEAIRHIERIRSIRRGGVLLDSYARLAGLSDEQLAEKAGVEIQTVVRWKKGDEPVIGEPKNRIADLFAEVLGVRFNRSDFLKRVDFSNWVISAGAGMNGMKNASAALGGIKPASSHPALKCPPSEDRGIN